MRLVLKKSGLAGRILLITEKNDFAERLKSGLEEHEMAVEKANTINALSEEHQYAVILLDSRTTKTISTDLISDLAHTRHNSDIIIISDNKNLTDSLTATNIEVIPSDTNFGRIIQTVIKAAGTAGIRQELSHLKQQVAMNFGFDNFIGECGAIRKIKETAVRVAPTDISVMISGASGTGRNLLAQMIYHHSNRRAMPLVRIDCATIPEIIFENEVFGRENANIKTGSLLLQSDNATLLLQNIHLMNQRGQERLLHLLKYSEIQNEQNSIPLSTRVMTITGPELEEKVASGLFTRELYNALSVIKIDLPTLKKRSEDIDLISDYLLRRFAHEMNLPIPTLDRSGLEKLMRYDWPGNISELENSLKRAFTLCHDSQITSDDIILLNSTDSDEPIVVDNVSDKQSPKTSRLVDSQRDHIKQALQTNNWNFTRTAEALGIGRTTLWRKVKKYELQQETESGKDITVEVSRP